MSVNFLHKTTKSVKSFSAALTAREKGDGRREMADVRKESEETGEGHIQRRYRYILIEALWVLGSYTDRQLRQCTADRTIIHTDREKSPHLMMTGRGSAYAFIRIYRYLLWWSYQKNLALLIKRVNCINF